MKKLYTVAKLGIFGLTLTGLMATSSADAQTYFVGAYLFAANGTGATSDAGYQYDTDLNSVAYALSVNGNGKNFSQLLTSGANPFTFSFTQGATPLTSNGDIGLFLSTTNTPYNPSTASRTPDLLVSATANGGAIFFTPAVNTNINNYHYGSSLVVANGLSAFAIGGNTVNVSAYSVTSTPSGTFTLQVAPTVTATPEPGTICLLAGVSISGSVFALRHRRRVKK